MTMMLHNYSSRQFHSTQNGMNSSSGFRDMGSASLTKVLPLFDKVFGPMTLHNYRSRQVHETLNGVNPSGSFRDMLSAKSGPNLWQVFGPWASPYGANWHMTMTVHTYRPRQFHKTSNEENTSSGYRDMGSAILATARPDRDDNTPPARRAEG